MKKNQILIVLISSLLPIVSYAQQIAVIDQGVNTNLRNNASYYSPLCFGVVLNKTEEFFLNSSKSAANIT